MEPDLPVVDEAELEEQRAREEDARITAELPELKMPFARARWEVDVSPCVLGENLAWQMKGASADDSSTTTISACWYYSIIPTERGVCSV